MHLRLFFKMNFYFYSIERHFLGHFSTQSPHCTHALLSTVHCFSSLFTVIALQGQFLAQSPQNTQESVSHLSPPAAPPAAGAASPPAAGAAFGASGILNVSVTFSVPGVVYSGFIVRHFFGQLSTHAPHCMHCILWISQVLASLFTVMAFAGHFLWQMPHVMHDVTSISTCPLVLSCHSLATTGYIRVAGFLNKLPSTTLPILNVAISRAPTFLYS